MSAAGVLTVNIRADDKWPTRGEHMLAASEHSHRTRRSLGEVPRFGSHAGCAVSLGREPSCDVGSGTTIPIPEIASGSSMGALRRSGVPPTSKGSSRRHGPVFACTSIDPNPQLRRQHDAYARSTQLRTGRAGGSWKITAISGTHFSRTFSSFGEGCSPAVGGTSPAQGAPRQGQDKQNKRQAALRRRPDRVFVAVPVRPCGRRRARCYVVTCVARPPRRGALASQAADACAERVSTATKRFAAWRLAAVATRAAAEESCRTSLGRPPL